MRVRILAIAAIVLAAVAVPLGIDLLHRSNSLSPQVVMSSSFAGYLQGSYAQAALPKQAGFTADSPQAIGQLAEQLNWEWSLYFPGVIAKDGAGSAGAALLASRDELWPICDHTAQFDPNGHLAMYCREPQLTSPPSASNPHTGNIVVPLASFMAALQKATDPAQTQVNAALLVAYFYTQHLQAELSGHGLASWQPYSPLQNCLTGYSLSLLVPQNITALQLNTATGFLAEFRGAALSTTAVAQIHAGFVALRPVSCFKPI